MSKVRTATTMIYCDSTRSVYGVYRGKMKGRYFEPAHPPVATYEYPAGARQNVDYKELTALHATPEAPAVRWQA